MATNPAKLEPERTRRRSQCAVRSDQRQRSALRSQPRSPLRPALAKGATSASTATSSAQAAGSGPCRAACCGRRVEGTGKGPARPVEDVLRGQRRSSIIGPLLLIAVGVVFFLIHSGRVSSFGVLQLVQPLLAAAAGRHRRAAPGGVGDRSRPAARRRASHAIQRGWRRGLHHRLPGPHRPGVACGRTLARGPQRLRLSSGRSGTAMWTTCSGRSTRKICRRWCMRSC